MKQQYNPFSKENMKTPMGLQEALRLSEEKKKERAIQELKISEEKKKERAIQELKISEVMQKVKISEERKKEREEIQALNDLAAKSTYTPKITFEYLQEQARIKRAWHNEDAKIKRKEEENQRLLNLKESEENHGIKRIKQMNPGVSPNYILRQNALRTVNPGLYDSLAGLKKEAQARYDLTMLTKMNASKTPEHYTEKGISPVLQELLDNIKQPEPKLETIREDTITETIIPGLEDMVAAPIAARTSLLDRVKGMYQRIQYGVRTSPKPWYVRATSYVATAAAVVLASLIMTGDKGKVEFIPEYTPKPIVRQVVTPTPESTPEKGPNYQFDPIDLRKAPNYKFAPIDLREKGFSLLRTGKPNLGSILDKTFILDGVPSGANYGKEATPRQILESRGLY